MNPMFFGESSSPLFGVYHPPTGSAYLNKAVLICSPIAHEHLRSYKSIRSIAKALANKGYHVMRFDYSGIGDSSLDLKDVSLNKWKEDISLAYNELIDISGVKKISLLGIRLGGTLALMSKDKHVIDKVMLWDPILNGGIFIRHMKDMHKKMFSPNRGFSVSDFLDGELLGFVFNKAMLNELTSLNISDSKLIENNVHSIFSDKSEEYIAVKGQNDSEEAVSLIEDSCGWNDARKIGDILMCNFITQKITDEF